MQKFHNGDWVRVAKDLGPHMSHFTGDCEAIVIGSYADLFGGKDHENYTLHLKLQGMQSKSAALVDASQLAADQIRKCDYTPARSTLLTALAAFKERSDGTI